MQKKKYKVLLIKRIILLIGNIVPLKTPAIKSNVENTIIEISSFFISINLS